ncbi:MAG: hypothetical protein JWR69_2602 [Pedosphaera sp.]|nr:hypothetical protein [Pedosphaera sp.]
MSSPFKRQRRAARVSPQRPCQTTERPPSDPLAPLLRHGAREPEGALAAQAPGNRRHHARRQSAFESAAGQAALAPIQFSSANRPPAARGRDAEGNRQPPNRVVRMNETLSGAGTPGLEIMVHPRCLVYFEYPLGAAQFAGCVSCGEAAAMGLRHFPSVASGTSASWDWHW